MDSRFIKPDKIDQKLRSELFKNYYEWIKRRNIDNDHKSNLKEVMKLNDRNFTDNNFVASFCNKKINLGKDGFAHAVIIIDKTHSKTVYLLPEEIDIFCTEHFFDCHLYGIVGCRLNCNIP